MCIRDSFVTSCAQYSSAPSYLENHYFSEEIQRFNVSDLNGNTVSLKQILEQHKGKKCVFDFWASCCKDCRKGMPILQALQTETKDNVVYVFFSVDKSQERWKKAITKMNIKGEHYFIKEGFGSNALSNYLGLDWIPRYLILDKTGKIVLAKSTNASDQKMRDLLLQ